MLMDLTSYSGFVEDMNISVKVIPHLGTQGDGKVNVGYIKAGVVDTQALQFFRNSDLGTVTVQGDLGGITVGDSNANTAIKSLNVHSFGVLRQCGRFGDHRRPGISSGVPKRRCHPELYTRTRHFFSRIRIRWGIRSQCCRWAIREYRNADDWRKLWQFKQRRPILFHRLHRKINIGGSILGGVNDASASFSGSGNTVNSIGSVVVGGSITGGSGSKTAYISAGSIGTVSVGQRFYRRSRRRIRLHCHRKSFESQNRRFHRGWKRPSKR